MAPPPDEDEKNKKRDVGDKGNDRNEGSPPKRACSNGDRNLDEEVDDHDDGHTPMQATQKHSSVVVIPDQNTVVAPSSPTHSSSTVVTQNSDVVSTYSEEDRSRRGGESTESLVSDCPRPLNYEECLISTVSSLRKQALEKQNYQLQVMRCKEQLKNAEMMILQKRFDEAQCIIDSFGERKLADLADYMGAINSIQSQQYTRLTYVSKDSCESHDDVLGVVTMISSLRQSIALARSTDEGMNKQMMMDELDNCELEFAKKVKCLNEKPWASSLTTTAKLDSISYFLSEMNHIRASCELAQIHELDERREELRETVMVAIRRLQGYRTMITSFSPFNERLLEQVENYMKMRKGIDGSMKQLNTIRENGDDLVVLRDQLSQLQDIYTDVKHIVPVEMVPHLQSVVDLMSSNKRYVVYGIEVDKLLEHLADLAKARETSIELVQKIKDNDTQVRSYTKAIRELFFRKNLDYVNTQQSLRRAKDIVDLCIDEISILRIDAGVLADSDKDKYENHLNTLFRHRLSLAIWKDMMKGEKKLRQNRVDEDLLSFRVAISRQSTAIMTGFVATSKLLQILDTYHLEIPSSFEDCSMYQTSRGDWMLPLSNALRLYSRSFERISKESVRQVLYKLPARRLTRTIVSDTFKKSPLIAKLLNQCIGGNEVITLATLVDRLFCCNAEEVEKFGVD